MPAWLTLSNVLATLFVVAVVLHQIGRYLLIKDPTSALGLRLVVLGIGLQALRNHPASKLLPPFARAVLHSLTDSVPPDSPPPPACTKTPGCRRVGPTHQGECVVVRS